jgi:hypothetical protein
MCTVAGGSAFRAAAALPLRVSSGAPVTSSGVRAPALWKVHSWLEVQLNLALFSETQATLLRSRAFGCKTLDNKCSVILATLLNVFLDRRDTGGFAAVR